MKRQPDWLKILSKCVKNIQKQTAPLLETQNKPQPSLGTGAGGDEIKETDLAAERAIVQTLRNEDVSFTLISEESGIVEYGGSPHRCFVTTDPIDGTTNMTRRIPFYATSIAVSAKPYLSTVYAALVADLFHSVVYTALKGKGTYRDGQKIAPSENTSLEKAVIGVDLNSFKVRRIVPRLSRLFERTKHLRHLGANALELCYVADGTLDGFVDVRGKLRATDVAAAWLVVKESGACLTTTAGKPLEAQLDPKQKLEFVAAANKEMLKSILSMTKSEKEAR